MEEQAIPRHGMAIEGGGEVTSGSHSPMLDIGIGMGYVPAALAQPGHGADDRRARQGARRPGREEADLREGGLNGSCGVVSRRSQVPPRSTTGPAIEGDEAVLGVTWFAADALGELVHYEAPADGATVTKDESYGEVESVKAVSDLIAPLSGEVIEVNQKVVDAPETVNEDPYGEGWLDPHPARRRVRGRLAARPRGLQARCWPSSDASVPRRSPTRDREEMLRTIGVSSVDELFRDIPAGMRLGRALDLEPALSEQELVGAPRRARRAQRRHDARAVVPRRRHLRPLRPRRRRRRAPARRVPHRVHAVPAGDEPGRAPDDLRVPDRDLRADRHGRLERLRLRRRRPSRPTRATSRSMRRARRRSSSPRRRTRRCARS